MSADTKPTVGRIVHVKGAGSDTPCAAIITALETDDGLPPCEGVDPVVVTLFPTGAPVFGIPVSRDDSGETDHSWRFPPRA